MSLLIELPLYKHRRPYRGLKIAAIIPNPRGIELHFENQRYTPIQVPSEWVGHWAAEVGGYYCHTSTGEEVYFRAATFEANYEPA